MAKEEVSKNKAEIESEAWEEVEYMCPKRGIKVKQLIKVIRYKPSKSNALNIIQTGDPMINDIGFGELIGQEETDDIE